jgi:acetyl esterase/lipase
VVAFYPPTDFLALQEPAAAETLGLGASARSLKLDRVSDALLARLFNLQCDDDCTERSFLDMIPDMIGGTPDEVPEVYRLLSPIYHVGQDCPPTLLLQGTDDIFGLLPTVRRLHHELRGAGASSILVEFPHTDHAFDLVLPQVSPVAQTATYDIERFLALLV